MWECGDCGEISDDFSSLCLNCESSKDRASKTGLSLEDVLSTPAVKPDNVPRQRPKPQKADLPTVSDERDGNLGCWATVAILVGLLALWMVYVAQIRGPMRPSPSRQHDGLDSYGYPEDAPTGGIGHRNWD